MNKLLAVLVAGVFAVSAGSALAADAKGDAMKADAMKTADKDKYKDCMKKDASGKETMDKACKDKMDKAAKSKGKK